MASINYAYKEIISKIVYYGPGLSGKTTNLQFVFKKVPAETRGELISLATDADRTLYFDFLPLNVGTIKGFATKFQLYTVPGQVYYNATRKLVLRGVDGIVFVVDSQAEKLDENLESFQNLQDNLAEYGYDIDSIPTVIQYNKRDLPNAMDISELERALNKKGFPYFEAVAPTGEGVFKTLKMISKMVLEEIRNNKMGASNAVKPQAEKPISQAQVEKPKSEPQVEQPESRPQMAKPEPQPQIEKPELKPQPVGVAVSSSEPTEVRPKTQAIVQTDAIEEGEMSEPPPEEPPVADEEEAGTDLKREVPGIVEDSETLANVVVSDSQHLPGHEEVEEGETDLEETTERAVLREETVLEDGEVEPSDILSNSDELSRDQMVGEPRTEREPLYGNLPGSRDFDDESTQMSDLNFKNPLPLGKPQMAESRKVKNKHKKFSLLGIFKKSKK
jgi:signal recognition particle receptor subunit beta